MPLRIIEDYKGYLQSDGYAAYGKPGRRDGGTHVRCLDHARRTFFGAVKAQHAVAGAERGLAPQALLLIRKICALEKLARDAKVTADARHRLRNEKARLLWDELRAWLDANRNLSPERLCSFVETAEAVGPEPYAYLCHIFARLPQAPPSPISRRCCPGTSCNLRR